MPLRFPVTIRRFRNDRGEVVAIIIRDQAGQSINLPCDPSEFRRSASHLWEPGEAEALAKVIARWLTDAWVNRLRQEESADPNSYAYRKNVERS